MSEVGHADSASRAEIAKADDGKPHGSVIPSGRCPGTTGLSRPGMPSTDSMSVKHAPSNVYDPALRMALVQTRHVPRKYFDAWRAVTG